MFVLLCVASSSLLASSRLTFRQGQFFLNTRVKSLGELRWNKLTRQGWDMSCGAAALSTLLTYHNGREFSELAITLSILKNSDPALVRKRGGFSLFDLKRFVRAVGFEGLGFGEMTLDDLAAFNVPAIIPVRIRDFDHFVVFRKRYGEHVLVGDPAFGNISLSAERFAKMWQSRIAFYVVDPEEKAQFTSKHNGHSYSPLSPAAMEVAIPSLIYGSRLLRRAPLIPVTRRSTVVAP